MIYNWPFLTAFGTSTGFLLLSHRLHKCFALLSAARCTVPPLHMPSERSMRLQLLANNQCPHATAPCSYKLRLPTHNSGQNAFNANYWRSVHEKQVRAAALLVMDVNASKSSSKVKAQPQPRVAPQAVYPKAASRQAKGSMYCTTPLPLGRVKEQSKNMSMPVKCHNRLAMTMAFPTPERPHDIYGGQDTQVVSKPTG